MTRPRKMQMINTEVQQQLKEIITLKNSRKGVQIVPFGLDMMIKFIDGEAEVATHVARRLRECGVCT